MWAARAPREAAAAGVSSSSAPIVPLQLLAHTGPKSSGGGRMSVCQEIQLTGVSSQSWERAAAVAIKRALESFADHCILRRVNESGIPAPRFTTEVVKLD